MMLYIQVIAALMPRVRIITDTINFISDDFSQKLGLVIYFATSRATHFPRFRRFSRAGRDYFYLTMAAR